MEAALPTIETDAVTPDASLAGFAAPRLELPPFTHHIDFRSHGGSDDPENQVGLCAFHHLRCIHGGFLAVLGRAPDRLTWLLGGTVWKGPLVRDAELPAS